MRSVATVDAVFPSPFSLPCEHDDAFHEAFPVPVSPVFIGGMVHSSSSVSAPAAKVTSSGCCISRVANIQTHAGHPVRYAHAGTIYNQRTKQDPNACPSADDATQACPLVCTFSQNNRFQFGLFSKILWDAEVPADHRNQGPGMSTFPFQLECRFEFHAFCCCIDPAAFLHRLGSEQAFRCGRCLK